MLQYKNMLYERFTPYTPSSADEIEERERRRVHTNAFIQDVDKELFEITETPPGLNGSDEVLDLCTSLARERRLQGLCYLVEKLIDVDSPLGKFDIDHPEGLSEDPVGPAIGIDENDRLNATNLGKLEATEILLHVLIPSDNDLLRILAPIDVTSQKILDFYTIPWRKDLLQSADLELLGDLTSGIKYYRGGTATLTLKTRFLNINYSLVYSPKEQLPTRYLYSVDKI